MDEWGSVSGGLLDGLVEQDHSANILADVLGCEEELAVSLTVGFDVFNSNLSRK